MAMQWVAFLSPPRAKLKSVKTQTFDGAEDFDEYLSQFNCKILVDLHGWNYLSIGPVVLSETARSVLSELNEDQMRNFNSLVKVLTCASGR